MPPIAMLLYGAAARPGPTPFQLLEIHDFASVCHLALALPVHGMKTS